MPLPFADARVVKLVAGPGCGKTARIAADVDALLAAGVPPERTMYLLFNRAPAAAFRARYAARGVPPDGMRWWGTHHAVCKRLLGLRRDAVLDLREWGRERGFALEEETEGGGLAEDGWDAVFASMSTRIYAGRTDFPAEERRLLDALKETEAAEGKYCHVRYMEKALRLGLFPPEVEYVFVDEAQDNGALQFAWLGEVAARPSVKGMLLAGDDKQAINGFKGADARLFLDFPADRVDEAPVTYRLPPAVLREANRVIEPVRERSEPPRLSAKPEESGEFLSFPSARDAWPLLDEAARAGEEVLVLARNGCFRDRAEAWLAEEGFPLDRPWRREAWKVCRALRDARLMGGVDEARLAALLPSAKPVAGQLTPTAFWKEGQVARLRSGGFVGDPAAMRAFEEVRLGGTLPLSRLGELGFSDDFAACVEAMDVPDGKWNLSPSDLADFRWQASAYGPLARPFRVSTVHAAKGEEADLVLVLSNVTRRTFQGELDDEDGERRVWYVALTRARRTLAVAALEGKVRTNILC